VGKFCTMTSPHSSTSVAGSLTAPAQDGLLNAALIEEACKKSGLIWVAVPGARDRAVWHVWHEVAGEGAVYLVVDGGEQQLPGLRQASVVRVTVRSKDKGGRLVTWPGQVTKLLADSPEWREVVPALHAKRLNAHDGEAQPERWAASSAIYRIQPSGAPLEGPGHYLTGSGAAPVPPSPATTRR